MVVRPFVAAFTLYNQRRTQAIFTALFVFVVLFAFGAEAYMRASGRGRTGCAPMVKWSRGKTF